MADWMLVAIGLALGAAIVWGWHQTRSGANAAQLAVAQTSLAEREKEAASLKTQLGTVTLERDAAGTELSTVREAASGVQASLVAREEELRTLRDQVLQLRTATEADEVALTQALQEVASLKSLTDERAAQLAIAHRKHADLEDSLTSLTADVRSLREERATIEAQHAALQEQKAQLDIFLADAQRQLKDAFAALAQRALNESQEQFLIRADERFKAQQDAAVAQYGTQTTKLEGLIFPVKESLVKLQEETHLLETRRKEEIGRVQEQLHQLGSVHKELSVETRKLTDALKSAKARGRWGETQLERLLELAGFNKDIDYYTQETLQNESGDRLRPDFIVRLPGNREVVIDSKVPFTGYYEAVEASSDTDRNAALERHAAAVQKHVRDLTSKDYQSSLPEAADFVVMFVPNDTFLAAAVEQRPELLDTAMSSRVVIVTPATLLALLHTIALGWRQQRAAANAKAILEQAEELVKRLGIFVEHVQAMNKHIESLQSGYRKLVGSLDRSVLPSARKMAQLGIKVEKPLTLAVDGMVLGTVLDSDQGPLPEMVIEGDSGAIPN